MQGLVQSVLKIGQTGLDFGFIRFEKSEVRSDLNFSPVWESEVRSGLHFSPVWKSEVRSGLNFSPLWKVRSPVRSAFLSGLKTSKIFSTVKRWQIFSPDLPMRNSEANRPKTKQDVDRSKKIFISILWLQRTFQSKRKWSQAGHMQRACEEHRQSLR
jgi:hypothetical protein